MHDPADLTSLSAHTFTRRRILAGSAFSLGAVVLSGPQARAQQPAASAKTIIPTCAIHQEEDFKTGPARLYDALLDAKQFSAFSGMPGASVSREVGGSFTIFSGHIIGMNLELVPNRRIVQSWRVVPWPEGIHSIARFELIEQGSGTRIVFDHTGFPTELAEHLESGWHEHYWEPLRRYFT